MFGALPIARPHPIVYGKTIKVLDLYLMNLSYPFAMAPKSLM